MGGGASLSTDTPIQSREAGHQPKEGWAGAFGEGGNHKRSYITALLHLLISWSYSETRNLMNNLITCFMVQAIFWKISLSPVSGIFLFCFIFFYFKRAKLTFSQWALLEYCFYRTTLELSTWALGKPTNCTIQWIKALSPVKSRQRLPSSPRVFDSHSTDILTKVLSLMWVMWALGVYTVVSRTTLKMWFGWMRFCFSTSTGALAMNSCTSEKPTATARYRHPKLFTLYPKPHCTS